MGELMAQTIKLKCSGCTVLDEVTITGRQTLADRIWNAMWNSLSNLHGYSYMSTGSGLGGNPFGDGRIGISEGFIMDPASGLLAFKGVNGKVFKWDGRTPLSKSEWQVAKEFFDYLGGTAPFLKKGADDVKLLIDYATKSYHDIWGKNGIPGKPRCIDGPNGIIFYDSIPDDSWSKDTLRYEDLTPERGWGNAQKNYDLLTQ
jgi:hypothetical protein